MKTYDIEVSPTPGDSASRCGHSGCKRGAMYTLSLHAHKIAGRACNAHKMEAAEDLARTVLRSNQKRFAVRLYRLKFTTDNVCIDIQEFTS